MATLRLHNLSKSFGPVSVVDNVSLDIPEGCFCALLGPSGCGKSTLLRMIAGIEGVSSGEIFLDGKAISKWHPRDRDMAMVFQSYALYPHMTVRENIAFPLVMRNVSSQEREALVGAAAAQLHLTDVLDRRPAHLSGGQRQRVAVARAIVRRPKVFLFDEPLSNLDAKLRLSTRTELKQLHQKLGITSIYVTHDQEEALALGDMVVVLAGGRVQQAATPLDLFDAPSNRFVAGFIGAPPMNFIPCTMAPDGTVINPLGLRIFAPFTASPRSVVLGIRPSSIAIDSNLANADTAIILTVEPLGDFLDVRLLVNSTVLLARIPARRGLQTSARVPIHLDLDRALLFESDSPGSRIDCEIRDGAPLIQEYIA